MNGKKLRAGANLFMSVVLSATLMVPNVAFAQTTTGETATATATAATTQAVATTQDTTTQAGAATATETPTSTTTETPASTTTQDATTSQTLASASGNSAASSDQGASSAAAAASSSTGSANADASTITGTSTETPTAVSAATADADATVHATGMTVDPAANAKQNAINESYNEALNAKQAQSTGNGTSTVQSNSTLPSSYSLRNVDGKVYVDGARQQGSLSDCWANSLSSCVESNVLKQTGGSTTTGETLSARQISWNIYKPVNSATVIAGRSIDPDQYGEGMVIPFGGSSSNSMQGANVLTSWQGLASESGSQAIPFQDSDGNKMTRSDKWAITEAQRDWSVAHVTDAELLPTPATVTRDGSGNVASYTYNEAGTTAIKQALMNTGAVQMNYFSSMTSDPVFNPITGAQYIDASNNIKYAAGGHSITVVGWDDDYAASNFTSNPGHSGAFLCKNSWGSYGETVTTQVTVAGQTETIHKRWYTDDSGNQQYLYLDEDTPGSGIFSFYKVVNGAVDMSAPVFKSMTLYNTDDALNSVFVDATGNKYTIHMEKASGTENSPTWEGYFWLSYYDTTILQAVSYTVDAPAANASDTYKYTHEYMYDYLGTAGILDTSEGAYDTTTTEPSTGTVTTAVVQAANVFTAKANEALTAVSAVTQSAASTIQLFIYRLINGATNPTQSATGDPELTMTVTETNAGYHTIALSRPLYLHAGESFSVVERITNEKGQGFLPIELAASPLSGDTWTAKCGTGESYISTDGGMSWTDVSTLTTDYFPMSKLAGGEALAKQYGVKLTGFGNAEIRAYTTDWTPAPTPTPVPTPTPTPAKQDTQSATATVTSYAPAAATTTVQSELPKTADNAADAYMLLVLLAAAGMGIAAIGIRRKAVLAKQGQRA